jgi:hypothetical protein
MAGCVVGLRRFCPWFAIGPVSDLRRIPQPTGQLPDAIMQVAAISRDTGMAGRIDPAERRRSLPFDPSEAKSIHRRRIRQPERVGSASCVLET